MKDHGHNNLRGRRLLANFVGMGREVGLKGADKDSMRSTLLRWASTRPRSPLLSGLEANWSKNCVGMSTALLSTRGLSAQLQHHDMTMSQPNITGFRRCHRSVGAMRPSLTPRYPQCSFGAFRLPTVSPPARPAIPAIATLRTRSSICSWRPRAASDAASGETDTPEHPKLLNILSFQGCAGCSWLSWPRQHLPAPLHYSS